MILFLVCVNGNVDWNGCNGTKLVAANALPLLNKFQIPCEHREACRGDLMLVENPVCKCQEQEHVVIISDAWC